MCLGAPTNLEYLEPTLPAHSLVITRNFGPNISDEQMYISGTYLRGFLPEPLISEYEFWQNSDDSIVGYQKIDIVERTKAAAVLRITLSKEGGFAFGKVSRIPIHLPSFQGTVV